MPCILIGATTGSLGASVTQLKRSDLDYIDSGVAQRAMGPPSLLGLVTGSLQANVTGSLIASVTGSLLATTKIRLNGTWCFDRPAAV